VQQQGALAQACFYSSHSSHLWVPHFSRTLREVGLFD
jgi:hypothetical protein